MTWIMDSLGSSYTKFSPEPDMDDWIGALENRFVELSEDQKRAYEFDPGVHEFRAVPVEGEAEAKYFAFHTQRNLEAIDVEQSEASCVKWYEDANKYRSNYGEIGSAGIVFDAGKTEGRGFWRDFTLHLPCYCISDDFKQAIKSLGLSFPKVFATRATV